jgi:hypothetical protein
MKESKLEKEERFRSLLNSCYVAKNGEISNDGSIRVLHKLVQEGLARVMSGDKLGLEIWSSLFSEYKMNGHRAKLVNDAVHIINERKEVVADISYKNLSLKPV